MKKIVGVTAVTGLLGWCAYVVYGWFTYTGVWQALAEWEIQQFGSYREKATLLTLITGPILLLNLPILIINIIRPGTLPYQLLGRPALRRSPRAGNPIKVLAAVAIMTLLCGSVAGFLGYQQMQEAVTFESVDLAHSVTPPVGRHVILTGIARTDETVVMRKISGGATTENIYLPVTQPDWRTGQPVMYFLNPHASGYAGPNGFQIYSGNTRPFAIRQSGTVFVDGLPGLVRTEFERRGIAMAATTYVVDTDTKANLDVYWIVTALCGLCFVIVLMTMLAMKIQRLRAPKA